MQFETFFLSILVFVTLHAVFCIHVFCIYLSIRNIKQDKLIFFSQIGDDKCSTGYKVASDFRNLELHQNYAVGDEMSQNRGDQRSSQGEEV